MRVYIASRISLYIDRYRTTVEQCIVYIGVLQYVLLRVQ
jgi:hypothetical protein